MICLACGTQNTSTVQFCTQCGAELRPAPKAEPAAAPALPTPPKYDYRKLFAYKPKEYVYAKVISVKSESFYCECIDGMTAFFTGIKYAKRPDLTQATVGDYIWCCLKEFTKVVDGVARYKVTCQTRLPSVDLTPHEFKLFTMLRKAGHLFRGPVTEETADYWKVQLYPNLYGKCYKTAGDGSTETVKLKIGDTPLFTITKIDQEAQEVVLTPVAEAAPQPDVAKETVWELLPKTMKEIIIPSKILKVLQEEKDIAPLAAALDGTFTPWKLSDLLEPLYRQAYEEKLITVKHTGTTIFIDFDTGYKNTKGAPISAGIKMDRKNSKKEWVLNLLGFTSVESVFDRFVYVSDPTASFNELADLTLGGEEWDYAGAHEKGKKFILKQYLRFNFYKSKLDDLLVVNEQTGDAVFNTGLVDSTYDDIFCYLKRNTNREVHHQVWELSFFACWGKGPNGKRLNTKFSTRPAAPQYIDPDRIQHIFYDVTKDLFCDYDHIIKDNLSRLPLAFIRRKLSYSTEVVETLDAYEASGSYRDFNKLLDLIVEDEDHLRDVVEGLKSAVETAKKHCKWNYKTAIPIYYPRNNNVSLLLPLCLSSDKSKADVALVVERLENGNYQGQTILTLQMAYLDARQICRPNSEWLTVNSITAEPAEETDPLDLPDEE